MPTLPYDLTNFTNMTGMDEFLLAINQSTGQLYFSSFPLIIFVVVLVGGLRFGTKISFLMASFVTAVLSMILYATGGIDQRVWYGSVVMLGFALMVNLWVRD